MFKKHARSMTIARNPSEVHGALNIVAQIKLGTDRFDVYMLTLGKYRHAWGTACSRVSLKAEHTVGSRVERVFELLSRASSDFSVFS